MTEPVRHTSIVAELAGGNTVTYFTVGVSMKPLLRERQTHVTIAPTHDPKPGDISLYVRTSGAIVLHRCMKTTENTCYMRGDNTYGLEPIPKSQVYGVVTHIYRRGKLFSVENRGYRVYVWFWNVVYPLRWGYHKLRQWAGKMYRRIHPCNLL